MYALTHTFEYCQTTLLRSHESRSITQRNTLLQHGKHGLTIASVATADICRPGARTLAAPLERPSEVETKFEDATGKTNADAQSSVAAAATQVVANFMSKQFSRVVYGVNALVCLLCGRWMLPEVGVSDHR